MSDFEEITVNDLERLLVGLKENRFKEITLLESVWREPTPKQTKRLTRLKNELKKFTDALKRLRQIKANLHGGNSNG